MSILDPSYAHLSTMPENNDQMDLMELSRSPAMQDIDIDLDFEDDAPPAGEDETMEGGYGDEDAQIDYDDEMVDEVVEQPEPADEEIQDVSADITDDEPLDALVGDIDHLQQSTQQESIRAPEIELLKDLGDPLQAPSEPSTLASFNDLGPANPTANADATDQLAVERDVAELEAQVDITRGPQEPATFEESATLHNAQVNGQGTDGVSQSFGITNELTDIGNKPRDDTVPNAEVLLAAEAPPDDTQTEEVFEGNRRLTDEATGATGTGDDAPVPEPGQETSDTRPTMTDNSDATNHDNSNAHREEFDAKTITQPVIVDYQGSEMTLFAPEEQSDHSDAYLLDDPTLASSNLATLFEAVRSVLGDAVGDDEHLAIEFLSLNLSVEETSQDAEQVRLSDVLSLYHRLHRNGGIESPDPMRLSLITRQRLSSALQDLQRAANEGRSFSELVTNHAELEGDASDYGSSDHTVEAKAQTGPDASNLTGRSSTAENGTEPYKDKMDPAQESRATPPTDPHVDLEDFTLEFESPLKASGAAAAKDAQDLSGQGDLASQEPEDENDVLAPTSNFETEAEDPEVQDLTSTHAASEEDAKGPVRRGPVVDRLPTEDAAEESHYDSTLIEDASSQTKETTNQDSFNPDEDSNVDIEPQKHQEITLEAEDHDGLDQLAHSTFEDDFLFYKDGEAATLLDEPLQAVSDAGPQVENLKSAAKITFETAGADFDASALLDDAAFDDAIAEDLYVEQPSTADAVRENGHTSTTEVGPPKENRKRSRSPEDGEADRAIDLAQAKKSRPS